MEMCIDIPFTHIDIGLDKIKLTFTLFDPQNQSKT